VTSVIPARVYVFVMGAFLNVLELLQETNTVATSKNVHIALVVFVRTVTTESAGVLVASVATIVKATKVGA